MTGPLHSKLHNIMENLMNPQLLYLENVDKLEFEANIIQKLTLPDGRKGVILERTYFYPTGGGQEYDTGTLGSAQVLDVFKQGDLPELVHVVDREVNLGPTPARIDAERRLRHQQHHTAQHLLTQCFVRLQNLETVSANINGYTPSTLDLVAKEVTKVDLDQVEDLANSVIYANKEVKTYFVTPEEVRRLPLRKLPSVNENIRIIEVDGYDYSACGGTHVHQTGSIGVVKILKAERQNEKIRIHFLAGLQAFQYFRSYYDLVSGLASQMSIHPQELDQFVILQTEQLKKAQRELHLLQQEKLVSEAQQLSQTGQVRGDLRLVLAFFEDRPLSELRVLVDNLRKMPRMVVCLATYDGQKISLIVACAESTGLSAQNLLRQQLQRINGRGGGDARIAQGGGPLDISQIQAFKDELLCSFLQ